VVNIASDAGRVGSSGEAVYSACKGGMIAFAQDDVARTWSARASSVNTLCPGSDRHGDPAKLLEGPDGAKIAEGLKRAIPMRRLGSPRIIPASSRSSLSDDAAYITGQTISVSGGLTMHG
jgi:2-hydroxycyclohexanecarboxyl-CoA dehydrogenase